MKVVCPVCGREGVIEQRGNSVRFVHYSWVNGKRVFMKHTVKMGTWEQRLGTENAFNSQNADSFLAVGLRRGARGPLNRKPSIGRAES
jgi:hypothetical protein